MASFGIIDNSKRRCGLWTRFDPFHHQAHGQRVRLGPASLQAAECSHACARPAARIPGAVRNCHLLSASMQPSASRRSARDTLPEAIASLSRSRPKRAGDVDAMNPASKRSLCRGLRILSSSRRSEFVSIVLSRLENTGNLEFNLSGRATGPIAIAAATITLDLLPCSLSLQFASPLTSHSLIRRVRFPPFPPNISMASPPLRFCFSSSASFHFLVWVELS
jgi:hypothetical protein